MIQSSPGSRISSTSRGYNNTIHCKVLYNARGLRLFKAVQATYIVKSVFFSRRGYWSPVPLSLRQIMWANNRSYSVCGWNSGSQRRLDHWLCKQWKKMKAPQKYKWKFLSWKVLVISAVICVKPYPVRGQITSCLFLILNLRAYLFILEVQHFSFLYFHFKLKLCMYALFNSLNSQ